MSWLEKIQNPLSITTGDGKKYAPKWKPTGKDVEYNVAVFEFPEVQGSLVRRGEVKGTRHNFDIYWDGEDHLDIATAFEISARNPKPWTVEHPYYGTILVHPMGMSFDHSSDNVTHITGGWIETITTDAPVAVQSTPDKILADKSVIDAQMCEAYSADVIPKAKDLKEMGDKTASTYKLGVKGISNTIDSEAYFNAFQDATKAINNATADPLMAIRQIQAMINMPFQFVATVKQRINTLLSQLAALGNSVVTIISRSSKKLYENNAGSIVSSIIAATITGATYKTRKDAVDSIEAILNAWNGYLGNLDSLQSLNGGVADSYMPDAQSLISLSNLVSYSVSALLQIATNAKQERTMLLEEDSSVVLLTKRFYGLKEGDAAIDEFIDTNEIGLDEMIIVPKGRKIIYYV